MRLTEDMIRSIKAASRRYVTLRTKDGTVGRFVDRSADGRATVREGLRAAGAPESAMAALTLAEGVPQIRVAHLEGLMGGSAAEAMQSWRVAAEGLGSPFAHIADTYLDQFAGIGGALGAIESPLGALSVSAWETMGRGVAAEAARLPVTLANDVPSITEHIANLGLATSSVLDGVKDLLVAPPSPAIERIGAGIADLLENSLVFDVSSVLSPIVGAQRLYDDSLAATIAAWGEQYRTLLDYPRAMLGTIAADVVGIQQAQLTALNDAGARVSALDWITEPLEQTAVAFQDAFSDRLHAFQEYNDIVYGQERVGALLATSTPVAYLTRGFREYVEIEVDPDDGSEPAVSAVYLGTTELDDILGQINPDLPKMRRSAWQTLAASHIEGRLSQAALSMRRMVETMLDDVAPVPSGTPENERFRYQISQLLPDNPKDSKLAASILDTFGKYGDRINMPIHIKKIYNHEKGLRHLMLSLEHMIVFMFTFGTMADRFDA